MYSFDRVLSCWLSFTSSLRKSRFVHLLVVGLLMSRMLATTGCSEVPNGVAADNSDDDSNSSEVLSDSPTGWDGENYVFEYSLDSYSDVDLEQSYGIAIETQVSTISCFNYGSGEDSYQGISNADMQVMYEALMAVIGGDSYAYYECVSHCADIPDLYSAGIGVGDDASQTMRYYGWEEGSYATHELWDLGKASEGMISQYCGAIF